MSGSSQAVVRLAIPRRVYTKSYIDYLVTIRSPCGAGASKSAGSTSSKSAPVLRHFTVEFEPPHPIGA